MKLQKNIYARICAIWAILIFSSTMFLFIIFYFVCFVLPEPQKTQWHRQVSRIWMSLFLFLSGIQFVVSGKEVFTNLENAIIVCNHNSLLDIPISFPFLPRANKTIAKKSFSYIPIFGWIYTFGTVLVDRKNAKSRQDSYDNMKKVLTIGLDMLIFPEGTRNKTEAPLKSFYDGAFKLAMDTQKPIVPVVLLNTKKILPSKPILFLLTGKVEMHILPVIYPQMKTIDTLKSEVIEVMSAYILANNKP